MTGPIRVALIGLPDASEGVVLRLLRDNGFEVAVFGIDSVDRKDHGRFREYDLVIANNVLADREDDEAFISFLHPMRGFLIFDGRIPGSTPPGRRLSVITAETSLEDILAAVSDVVFSGGGPGGRPARTSPRIQAALDVAYESGAARHESRITTLSENGAFIATLNPPPNGERVKLGFFVPGEKERVVASGKVLYAIGYDLGRGIISGPDPGGRKIGALPGIGVVFEEISEAGREAIRRFIERRRHGE